MDYTTYNDVALLELLKEGDESAFREIYDRHADKLFKSAYRKLTNREQAEEITQDILLDLWKRRQSLEIQHLPAYLEKAVRFKVINFFNRNKLPHFLDVFESLLFSPYEADAAFRNESFDKLLESWIEALPEKQRIIFVKHYVDGLSTKEIAEQTGLAHKTIQNNLSLSLQLLRTRYSQLLVTLAILHEFI